MTDKKTNKDKSRQGNKRIALLLVLKALEQKSDKDNPIKQTTLAKLVNDVGGLLNLDIWCDRKTVGRHIKLLVAAGYNVVSVKGQGYYLESNKFTKHESEILVGLINESILTDSRKKQLIDKLLMQQENLDVKTFKENL